MEEVPKSVPVRLKAVPSGDHPDPDLLAALAEQALPERERAQALLHLSRCADCREVFALAIPPATATASPALDTGRRSWFQWRLLRWAAAGACVVIVGSAVLMKRDTMMTSHKEMLRAETASAIQSQSDSVGFKSPASDRDVNTRTVSEQKAAENAYVIDSSRPTSDESGQLKARKQEPEVANAPAAAPELKFVKPDRMVAGAAVGGGLRAGMGYRSKQMAAMAPSAEPVAAATARQDKKFGASSQPEKELPMQARNTTNLQISQQNEVVEVQAAAAAVQGGQSATPEEREKYEAPGKAKAGANAMELDRAQTADEGSMAFAGLSANKVALAKSAHGAVAAYSPLSRWTISSDGQLQHSTDAGKTWQPVAVAEKTSFRALSANGPDLWVGGAAGQLYHSTDAGGHWAQVKPTAGSSVLSDDIAAIEFTDTQHGKITTANGEVWITSDGGQAWRKQS